MLKLVLAENMNLMRSALTSMLTAEADLTVVAALACDSALPETVLRLRPDVVVVDIVEPLDQCLGAVEEVKRQAPDVPVVALTSNTPAVVRRLLHIPVSSAIDRRTQPARLIEAIRTAASGHRVVDVSLAVSALVNKPNPLTPQEMEVLRRAAGGATGPEIARQLHLSVRTVRNYLSRASVKTSARGKVDAVRIARESGWL